MAKYTDPNTGVKYSTHTGLKVFTVLVVILLVVSIVLNVVLYTQNSDDSELDSESGELYDDSEGSGDGDDGDGENPDGILPDDGDGEDGEGDTDSSDGESFVPPLNPEDYEDYIDTDTVVENEDVEIVEGEEFDENGVTKCIRNYGDDCYYCEGECVGHELYLTTGGGTYDFYPVLFTQLLVCEDGSMDDINSKIRVSIVFDNTWNYSSTEYLLNEDGDVDYIGYYYTNAPSMIEIASLTGEPLEIESIEYRQHIYFETVRVNFSFKKVMYYNEEGAAYELDTFETKDWMGWYTYSDTTQTYNLTANSEYSLSGDGYYTLTLKMTDGSVYTCSFWGIGNPSDLVGVEVVYV